MYTICESTEHTIEDIMYVKEGEAPCYILGTAGAERELRLLQALHGVEELYTNVLPVFLGFGCGYAVEEYLQAYKGKCILVDIEGLYEQTKHLRSLDESRMYIVSTSDTEEYSKEFNSILHKEGYPLSVRIVHPFHSRHNKAVYRPLVDVTQNIATQNPFAQLQYKHFTGETKILCIWSCSFITDELEKAFAMAGIDISVIELDGTMDASVYIADILERCTLYKPDFIFTVNHTCFDDKGFLAEIIWNTKIPFASWFMDSPELDIEKQPKAISPYSVVFTYDAQNIEYLHSVGFEHAYYMPLGTDITRFAPTNKIPKEYRKYRNCIGFLGNSHATTIAKYIKAPFTPLLHKVAHAVAECFRLSEKYTVAEVLHEYSGIAYEEYFTCSLTEQREYVQYIIDLATQKKRILDIINANILPITVAGDTAWKTLLAKYKTISCMPALPYGVAHYFYAQVEMVINSTCTQMKHAVNQRVFDVPSSGAFILTEKAEQIHGLFEVGKEVICYGNKEELQETIQYYHTHKEERLTIIQNAQKRIAHEHTWGHRVRSIVAIMEGIYR